LKEKKQKNLHLYLGLSFSKEKKQKNFHLIFYPKFSLIEVYMRRFKKSFRRELFLHDVGDELQE